MVRSAASEGLVNIDASLGAEERMLPEHSMQQKQAFDGKDWRIERWKRQVLSQSDEQLGEVG